MTNAATLGVRILEGFAEGRKRAIAQAKDLSAPVERAVRQQLDVDLMDGHPERGRAVRIARALRGRIRVYHRGEYHNSITPRGVKQILKRLALE